MFLESLENLFNQKLNRIFFDGEWYFITDFVKKIESLESQQFSNGFEEAKNSIESNKDNVYKYIEFYLKKRNFPNNAIRAIQIIREKKIPTLSGWPYSQQFQNAINFFLNKRVYNPIVPSYNLSLAPESLIEVLRIVTDFNERGYQTKVVRRELYSSDKSYFDKKIKNKNERLTIGDCFWGELEPIVREYDNMGRLIGYYSECMASIHPEFRTCEDFYDSAFCRIFATIEPCHMKSRLFSLKIVDESPFPMTIIIPTIHRCNSNVEMGEKVYIQVLASYKMDKNVLEYGNATSDEETYNEYLLWQLNNHFFIRYDLQKSKFSYDNMLQLKNEKSFLNLLKMYKLATSSDELKILNQTKGEQNSGIIINKLLKAEMAILYSN